MCRDVGRRRREALSYRQSHLSLHVSEHSLSRNKGVSLMFIFILEEIPKTVEAYLSPCRSFRRLPLILMTIAYYQIVKVLWRSDTIPGHSNIKAQKASYHRSNC